jgi:DNA methylase
MSSAIVGRSVIPDPEALERLREAALDDRYVSMGGRRTLTVHEFYRYPGRFTPAFAAAAVRAFSSAGNVVCDPFVGGGTTLVEARLAGRLSLGADLSPLAAFVARAKAIPSSDQSLDAVLAWGGELGDVLNIRNAVTVSRVWQDDGYLRQLRRPDTWRLRKLISLALATLNQLPQGSSQDLARLCILRTSQWALDMRRDLPSVAQFRDQLISDVRAMTRVAGEYARHVVAADQLFDTQADRTRVLMQGLPGLAASQASRRQVDLLLLSPPYPGVYVLYHRWKLRGRKEIPAPFWIANCLDGHGHSHYTMHARRGSLPIYFQRLLEAFADLAKMARPGAWMVQMVGFSEPASQLGQYLRAMADAGFAEVRFPELATEDDGRLWRPVPGRRWWVTTTGRDQTAPYTAREVVLIHRRS